MSEHDDQDRSAVWAAQDRAADVLARMVAGPLSMGGLGWLADRWLGTSFLVAIGVLVGAALSLYVVWFRYGRS